MLTTAQLIEKIRDALANSQDISSWCFTKYGRRPTIFVGIDVENPPAEADYPVIVIEDIVENHGNTQGVVSWTVSIGVGVVDDTVTVTNTTIPPAEEGEDPTPIATIRTYDGVVDVEVFREAVEAVLKAERFAKFTFNTETAPLSLYPEFNSFTFATIEQIYSRRR